MPIYTKTTAKPIEVARKASTQKTTVALSKNEKGIYNSFSLLQRTAGNQAALRLLRSGAIRTKLNIGPPGDVYEQDADRIADQVMRMPDPSTAGRKGVPEYTEIPSIQRMCAECEEELQRQTHSPEVGHLELSNSSEEELLQTKEVAGSALEVTPSVESQINGVRGGGQPLPESVRAFFEPRLSRDFSHVRIHTDSQANESAKSLNALAYTAGTDIVFGAGQYTPETESGKKLIAHELTHVVQQEADGSNYIQRDLALTPPNPDVAEPVLSDAEIRDAIDFNNRRYRSDVIRLIQDVVGAGVTGTMDEDTVMLIALIQAQFNLADVDGKAGPDTFDLLVRELSAESAPTDTCMTMFRIRGPRTPLDLRVAGPGLADIFSRFDVEARFSPRCNCSDFEYRQFICGDVTRTTGGVTTSENHVFSNLPAGQLLSCPDWREDGDTSVPIRYGHRSAVGRVENRYLDDAGNVDQANGCTFESFDVPGIWGLTAVSGSQYDFDIRFFGDVRRKGVGRIERKFWALRDTITIP